jgi:hypothetical protein
MQSTTSQYTKQFVINKKKEQTTISLMTTKIQKYSNTHNNCKILKNNFFECMTKTVQQYNCPITQMAMLAEATLRKIALRPALLQPTPRRLPHRTARPHKLAQLQNGDVGRGYLAQDRASPSAAAADPTTAPTPHCAPPQACSIFHIIHTSWNPPGKPSDLMCKDLFFSRAARIEHSSQNPPPSPLFFPDMAPMALTRLSMSSRQLLM